MSARMLGGIEAIVVRRRLGYFRSLCPLSDSAPPRDVDRVYDELLELVRYAVGQEIVYEIGMLSVFSTDPAYTLRNARKAHFVSSVSK
jgi:hypothetical protein